MLCRGGHLSRETGRARDHADEARSLFFIVRGSVLLFSPDFFREFCTDMPEACTCMRNRVSVHAHARFVMSFEPPVKTRWQSYKWSCSSGTGYFPRRRYFSGTPWRSAAGSARRGGLWISYDRQKLIFLIPSHTCVNQWKVIGRL